MKMNAWIRVTRTHFERTSKNLICLFGLVVLTFGCRKDTEPEPEATPSNTLDLVTTPGSYWNYQWYEIAGSNGTETVSGFTDSVYVVGDTIINGKVYTHMQGDHLAFENNHWFRTDSSGCIISSTGAIVFGGYEEIDTTAVTTVGDYTIYTIIKKSDGPVTVPAGTFSDVWERQFHHYKTNGDTWACGSHWISRECFAEGVGVILYQEAYVSMLENDCSYLEARLTNYVIAP